MRLQKYAENSFYFIMALLPFHGLLAVWITSLVGRGLLVRSWKEILLVPTVCWLLVRLFKKDTLVLRGLTSMLAKAMLIYIGLAIAYFVVFNSWDSRVTTASLVGLVADTRFFVFFLSTYIVFSGVKRPALSQKIMRKIILIPAGVVATVALLQVTLLPKDVLSHFGFVKPKYQPVLYIDQDNIFLRARSTLRGPNELGAYLIAPLLLTLGWLKRSKKMFALAGLLLAGIVFSYSRSAAVGLLVACSLLYTKPVVSKLKSFTAKTTGRLALVLVAAAVILGITFAARTNTFSTLVFHNNRDNSTVGSTGERIGNAGNLFKDIVKYPLGNGLGTSGPASQYGSPNIPDNYYVQISYEMGLLGLASFLAACYLLWQSLWAVRSKESRILAACFIGLMLTNLFLHNWADDTLSMYFFGLCGWLLATSKNTSTKNEN